MTKQRGIHVWQFVDATERDATGAVDGLRVNDVGNVAGGSMFICTTVNPTTSSWVVLPATAINALDWKESVRVATTAAGTLATSFEAGDTIDGVVLVAGNRILIKDQAAPAENGIYTVNSSGAPTRAIDADEDAEVTSGMTTYVEEGTANAQTTWILTTANPITVGVTGLSFSSLGTIIDAPLSVVLANGNTTGGVNVLVSNGDDILSATDNTSDIGSGAARFANVFAYLNDTNGVEFNQVAANPGVVSTNTLYQDDGTNYEAGTLVWDNKLVVTGETSIGDPGLEQGSISVNGAVYDAILKVNDIGNGFDALAVYHRHSTTDAPNVLYARTNSDTDAHAIVTNGMSLGGLFWAGHDGTDYNLSASIVVEVDGAPGANDMPGRIILSTSPDASNVPVERMRIDAVGDVTVANSLYLSGAVGTDGVSDAADLVIGDGLGAYGITGHVADTSDFTIAVTDATAAPTMRGALAYNDNTGRWTISTEANARAYFGQTRFAPVAATYHLGATGSRFSDGFINTLYLAGAASGDANAAADDVVIGDGTTAADFGATVFVANAQTGSFDITDTVGTLGGGLNYSPSSGNVTLYTGAGNARFRVNSSSVHGAVAGARTLGTSAIPWGTAYLGASGGGATHEMFGGGMVFANVNTDLTNKEFYLQARPYTNTDGNWTALRTLGDSGENYLFLGGTTAVDSATQIRFFTATALNSVGVQRGSISSDSTWTIGTAGSGINHNMYGAGITPTDTLTDLTNKNFKLRAQPYTNANGSWLWASYSATAAGNAARFGGNTTDDSATVIEFYTATALNTAGTQRGNIDSSGLFNWLGNMTLDSGNAQLTVGDNTASGGVNAIITAGTNGTGWMRWQRGGNNRWRFGLNTSNDSLWLGWYNTSAAFQGEVLSFDVGDGAMSVGFSGIGAAHSITGNSLLVTDVTTDTTNKLFKVTAYPYTNAHGVWTAIQTVGDSGNNQLRFGNSADDSPTLIQFYTASALNTAGTLNGQIANNGDWTLGRSGGSNTHLVWGSIWGRNVDTDATDKTFIMYGGPHTNSQGAWQAIRFEATSTNNTLRLGGGGAADSATSVAFMTATALNSVGVLRGSINNAGNWTIGGAGGAADHIVYGDTTLFTDITTDVTAKQHLLVASPYTNSHGSWQWAGAYADASNNIAFVGGTNTGDAATQISFFTATALNTAGTQRGTVDSAGGFNWSGGMYVAGASVSDAPATADDQIVGDGVGSRGVTIYSGTSSLGRLVYTDGSAAVRGNVDYDHSLDALVIGAGGSDRFAMDNAAIYTAGPNYDLGKNGAGAFRFLFLEDETTGPTVSSGGAYWVDGNSTPHVATFRDEAGDDHPLSLMQVLEFNTEGAHLPSSGGPTLGYDASNGRRVLSYSSTSTNTAYWIAFMPREYTGNGVTVRLYYQPNGNMGAADTIRWSVGVERFVDDSSYSSITTTDTTTDDTPGTSYLANDLRVLDIAISSGNMASIAAGDSFMLKVERLGAHANDDYANTALLQFAAILQDP